ncbi:5-formyltetrahydrofolate cyclo-ligase [Fructilactobacillus florum]|uniref:5-formyltetrahydrofolate cyclo-ligase n=2 Tax=Fructilactobacillus florum TaxID=640331 RepID=A0A0R2CPP3_9LACO|nr:5-formyltetrahydrofolate cyclo-ligase [Fructilactobacillus florum]EKK20704.1 5-formyltetrahydrofolate cyclo-ligase [Fructilactobacillus florum 2F]KRM91812.1 5-formyltetrahydrofolate cyclo-ligase [Fructilactobacillus florum DSM 22689 = JCM 16035]
MKTVIRTQVLARLHENPFSAQGQRNLLQKVLDSPQWQRAQTIGITLSFGVEIPTQPLITAGQGSGKRMVIPKTGPQRQMEFVVLSSQTGLQRTKFGVLEPVGGTVVSKSQIDLMVVPGIAFCLATGQRIGYGGGYFDRYLRDYRQNTIALARPFQVFPTQEWRSNRFDIPVHQIFTSEE